MTDNKSSTVFRNRYESKLGSGAIIEIEGPGNGFASYPWILNKYERKLGLKPEISWALILLLKYLWKSNGLVFPSKNKITRESNISKNTLIKYFRVLENDLGYIQEVKEFEHSSDKRKRYNLTGILNALTICIKSDENSRWSGLYGSESISSLLKLTEIDFQQVREVNEYFHREGSHFDWCTLELQNINKRQNGLMKKECENCGSEFIAYSHNSKFCYLCKEEMRTKNWEVFQAEFLRLSKHEIG